MSLSPRLQRIANQLADGRRIADIGTDHAYLPIVLAEEGLIDYALASDIGAGPTEIAAGNVRRAGLVDVIEVKQADGLTGITETMGLDTIFIAGMGGELIVKILTQGLRYLDGTEALVLSPNRDAAMVRTWLAEQNFGVVNEELVEDSGHLYPVIVAAQTSPAVPYTRVDLLLGPIMRRKRGALFEKDLVHQINALQQAIAGLEKAKVVDSVRLEQAREDLKLLEGENNG